jgi:N-acetylmuramoyl-L-alanine amidase
VKKLVSPNYNERSKDVALEYIVLHYTGMRCAADAIERLCDPEAKVSAHYVIDEGGGVLSLVEEEKRAWQAGESFWRGVRDMNSASIGIELVNPGHEFGYRPFPEVQTAALMQLLGEIIERRKMSPQKALLAHSDIAPARKKDPGELFPWEPLALRGYGAWPVPSPADLAPLEAEEALRMLREIGYETSTFSAALLAFQRRYYPQGLSGKLDAETAARLRALRRSTP